MYLWEIFAGEGLCSSPAPLLLLLGPQAIYVARNAKDNLVSYFHFDRMNLTQPEPGPWESYIPKFMEGKCRYPLFNPYMLLNHLSLYFLTPTCSLNDLSLSLYCLTPSVVGVLVRPCQRLLGGTREEQHPLPLLRRHEGGKTFFTSTSSSSSPPPSPPSCLARCVCVCVCCFFCDQNPQREVERIMRYLEVSLADDVISHIVELTSFKAMKENPMANYTFTPPSVFDQTISPFMRKGLSLQFRGLSTCRPPCGRDDPSSAPYLCRT